MLLTREDLELLKRLQAAGERGRSIPEFNTRIALQRLARGGYAVARTGLDEHGDVAKAIEQTHPVLMG